jgi:hypothetical protein
LGIVFTWEIVSRWCSLHGRSWRVCYAETGILGGQRFVCGRRRALSLARAQPPGCAVSHSLVCPVNRRNMITLCIAIAANFWARFWWQYKPKFRTLQVRMPASPPKCGMRRGQRASRRVTPPRARNNEHARMRCANPVNAAGKSVRPLSTKFHSKIHSSAQGWGVRHHDYYHGQ